MPFFASLWAKDHRNEFASVVAESVSRVACLGLLAASAMISLGKPAIDLVFTGGHFSHGDASQCFAYFAVFSISMSLWSAQAIYSRAFYAAGNTFVPMAAGTVATLISLPIYFGLFHSLGAMGLAVASDIGIAMQTLAVAGLLHQRRMVSLASLDYREMGRCLASGVAAGAFTWFTFSWVAGMLIHSRSRWFDLVLFLSGGSALDGDFELRTQANGIRVAESSDEAAPNRLTRQSDAKSVRHQDPCRGRGPCGQTGAARRWQRLFRSERPRLGVGLANIDAALEECAVFDADASRRNIAGQSAFSTDVNAIGSV